MDSLQRFSSVEKVFNNTTFDNFFSTVFIVMFIVLSTLSYVLTSYGSTTAPDFVQNIFFSKQLSTTGSLRYCNDLNRKYDTSIFGSRGLKITTDKNCLTHGSMHGFILILSIFQKISDKSLFLAVPIFSIICLVYFFKICTIYFSVRESLIGVILLFFSPSYFYHSVILFNNIPALCFLVVGIYYFIVTSLTKNSLLLSCISFLSLGIMVWIRYEYIVFVIPIICFWLFAQINDISIIDKVIPLGVFSLALLLLTFLNFQLYGGVLKFAGSKETSLSNSPYYNSQIPIKSSQNLFQKVGADILLTNIFRYVVKYNPVIFFLCFFALYLSIVGIRSQFPVSKHIIAIFSFILLFPIIFYLRKIWTGYFEEDAVVANSYVRYLLPSYLIMTFFSLRGVKHLGNIQTVLLISTYVVVNFSIIFNSAGGIRDYLFAQKTFTEKQASILTIIPEQEAVVFVSYFDKYIFPKRNTAIYTSFPEDVGIEMTASLINKLVMDNIPVYFIDEDWATNYIKYPHDKYFENILAQGLSIKNVSPSIYKIEKTEN